MNREGGAKTMRARRGFRFAAALVLLAGAGLTGLSFATADAIAATPAGLSGILGCPNNGGTTSATVLVSGSVSGLPASSLLNFGVHDPATSAAGGSTVNTDGSGNLTLTDEIVDTSSNAYMAGDTANWELTDQSNNVQASGSFVIGANQCATTTPGGTASGTATCNSNGTYAVVVTVQDVVSSDPAYNSPQTGYASVGIEVVDSSNNVLAGPIGTNGQQSASFAAFNFDAKGANSANFTVTTLRNVGVADMPLKVTLSSCSPPPPVLTQVTPVPPTATTPNCTNQSETVTPSSQTGVIWSPASATKLNPGQSVTYTASPDNNYVFPVGAQTSWTFSNGLDTAKCLTPPPPPAVSAPTVTLNASQATPMAMQAVSSSVTVSGSATLSWNSKYATSLTASGNWSGPKSVPSGSETVTPSKPGTYTYVLTASGPGGTASASVTVVVTSVATTPAPSPSPSSSKTHTNVPSTTVPTASHTATPGSQTSSQTQVGPVPHTGFTGTFRNVASYPYGWARVPGIVLFATGLLFGGILVLKRREATQR